MITLKGNERLVFAGHTALRAPDGTPLTAVPQYAIVSADEAESAAVRDIKEDERLIQVGVVLNDKKRAEERFAALKAGKTPPPRESAIPLYIKEDAKNINVKTQLSQAEEEAIDPIIIKGFLMGFAARQV